MDQADGEPAHILSRCPEAENDACGGGPAKRPEWPGANLVHQQFLQLAHSLAGLLRNLDKRLAFRTARRHWSLRRNRIARRKRGFERILEFCVRALMAGSLALGSLFDLQACDGGIPR
ncbi:hypothetical protein [Bosea lathyri]|uniref:hypothetical protein n=1 Tax=Bosea lathyri TaxID=1036778 RepID=UPI0011B07A91|nr:hypothetical protein [Bosea lathyri]